MPRIDPLTSRITRTKCVGENRRAEKLILTLSRYIHHFQNTNGVVTGRRVQRGQSFWSSLLSSRRKKRTGNPLCHIGRHGREFQRRNFNFSILLTLRDIPAAEKADSTPFYDRATPFYAIRYATRVLRSSRECYAKISIHPAEQINAFEYEICRVICKYLE